eukprot:478450_1
MLLNDLVVSGVAAVSLLLLISLAPILVYYYYKYRSLQKSVIFRKRYAEIVSLEVQIGLFKIIIGALIYISLLIWFQQHKYKQNDRLSFHFNSLIAIDYITTLILFYVWIWRFWLLHFRIHINVAILANEWKYVINSKHKDTKGDWYLNNRSKYGNKNYIRNRFIIPACLMQCSLIIIPLFMTSYYNTIWWTIYFNFHIFIPFCTLITIYFTTCKFSDNFYITKELQKIFICLSVTYSLMFIGNILQVIFNFSINISTIFYCIQVNIVWIGIFFSLITAIYWVPKKVLPLITNRNYELREVPIRKAASDSYIQCHAEKSVQNHKFLTRSRSQYDGYYENANDMEYVEVLIIDKQIKKNVIGNIQNRKIKLSQILSHPKGFEMFVNHLTKEFACECLLSMCEMIQFQQSIYELLKDYYSKCNNYDENKKQFDEMNSHKKSTFFSINFPNNVPLSEIVYNGFSVDNNIDIITDYKIKAHKLYMKYMDYNSAFQINIPFKIRQNIGYKMRDYNSWIELKNVTMFDLLKLFDKTCAEMYKLMLSSYDRFSLTHNYNKLKDCIFL